MTASSAVSTASANSASPTATSAAASRELVLTRLIAAPREKMFQAWTRPELMVKWFAPRPWGTSHVELDLRPGGSSLVVMRSPEGQEFPNRGIYLEVVENERLVFTDAYTDAWTPSEKPFMTVVLTFADETGPAGPATRYIARVLHWTAADRDAHEKMGFQTGWGQCTDQLAELVGAPKPLP